MDILMVTHFTHVSTNKENGRFIYLANLIKEQIHDSDIEIVTTTFSHKLKKQQVVDETENRNYRITMCFEPGYSKNVCLRRFYSHYIFGKNLKKYLDRRKRPDLIYCAVPSLDAAGVVATYAKEKNIKLIIDVQDIWPEAFEMVFHVPVISNIIFEPMKRMANKIYAQADEIIGVSDTYCQRAEKVNQKVDKSHTIFLGTSLKKFDKSVKKYGNNGNGKKIKLAYCGTLGHSYDIRCAIDAMCVLRDKGITEVEFIVMGDGPLKKVFQEYATQKNVNTCFTGNLDYEIMCGTLASCDIAINPITHGAAQSIINKHGDYAAAGIPVVSTQENAEYRKLVEEYEMGFNCSNNNPEDVAEKIYTLIKDKHLCLKMGKNARRCAEEKFDRDRTYMEVISVIKGLGD